jgi:hypothetical protein
MCDALAAWVWIEKSLQWVSAGLWRSEIHETYLLLAVLGLPPDFVACKSLDLLPFFPWTLGHNVSLYKALEVVARSVLSCAPIIRVGPERIVIFWIFPELSFQTAHHAVVWCQYGCVLCGVVQAASYVVHVSRESAEDGYVLRLPYDIGYYNSTRDFSGGRHYEVAQRRLIAEYREGLANSIEGAGLCRAGEKQADACDRVCDKESSLHIL